MPEAKPIQHVTVIESTTNNDIPPIVQEYKIESYEKIGSGMEGVIYRVQIKNSEGKLESFVLKILSDPVSAPELKDKYELAKQAGLPVPEFFKVSNSGILMSDLSNNGQNLVLSYNDFKSSRIIALHFKYPDLMETFSQQDMNALKPDMVRIAQQAAQNKISIDHDDAWFFVMNPNGEMRIVLTDFLHVQKASTNPSVTNLQTLQSLMPPLIEAQNKPLKDEKPFWRR